MKRRDVRLNGDTHQRRDQGLGVGCPDPHGRREAHAGDGQHQVRRAAEEGDDLLAPVLLALGQLGLAGLGAEEDDKEANVEDQTKSALCDC